MNAFAHLQVVYIKFSPLSMCVKENKNFEKYIDKSRCEM